MLYQLMFQLKQILLLYIAIKRLVNIILNLKKAEKIFSGLKNYMKIFACHQALSASQFSNSLATAVRKDAPKLPSTIR